MPPNDNKYYSYNVFLIVPFLSIYATDIGDLHDLYTTEVGPRIFYKVSIIMFNRQKTIMNSYISYLFIAIIYCIIGVQLTYN